jgi:hypothetical protein
VATDEDSGPADDTLDSGDAFKAEPERGGCFQLGWGCLPVIAVALGLLPLAMF